MAKKTMKDFETDYNDSAEGRARIRGLQETIKQLTHCSNVVSIEAATRSNTIRFGVISDTHLGNTCERLDALAGFLKLCKSEKINDIVHAGDVFDGHDMYKGHVFELHAVGWNAQKKHALDNLPRIEGQTVHFIAGNHDSSFTKLAGVDVGSEFGAVMPGWNYLGQDQAEIVFKTKNGREFKIMLMHPAGGTAYAISYKTQKIIESLEGGTKPNMLIVGHYHKAELMPVYRNVVGMQAGTFEAQTPFMKRIPATAHVGGWIVEVVPGPKGSLYNRIKTEFIAHY